MLFGILMVFITWLLNASLYQRKYSKQPFCELREEKKNSVYICLENGTVRRACGLHPAPCHSQSPSFSGEKRLSISTAHTGMLDTWRQHPASRCECLKIQPSCDSIRTVICKCGSVGNLWKTFITTALSEKWEQVSWAWGIWENEPGPEESKVIHEILVFTLAWLPLVSPTKQKTN